METQGGETPAQSRIQWAQITITALTTAFLSLAVALLVFYFTSKEPRLTYEIFPTSSFSGETRDLIIQNIRIQNEGDKEAEQVQVVVSFPASAKISDANFEASSLALEVNSVPDTSEFKRAYEVPMLNQNEYISFSFLVENYSGQGIDVDVRGTGLNGVLKKVSNVPRPSTLTVIIIIIVSIAVILFGVWIVFLRAERRMQRIMDKTWDKVVRLQGEVEFAQEMMAEAKRTMDAIQEELESE